MLNFLLLIKLGLNDFIAKKKYIAESVSVATQHICALSYIEINCTLADSDDTITILHKVK